MKMSSRKEVTVAISVAEVESNFEELKRYLVKASERSSRIDEIERGVFEHLQRISFAAIEAHIEGQGDGDVGETLILEDGRKLKRLEKKHSRKYVSIFGRHELMRTAYGTRETQKIEAVPLDAILGLPEGDFSYVLQDWDQGFCVEQPFSKSAMQIERIFKLSTTSSSLQHMNRSMSETIDDFRATIPAPPAEAEGEIMVLTADCKGVPHRRQAGDPAPKDPKHPTRGEKRNKKKMACVGVSYTVDRFVRTTEDILNEVLHKKSQENRPRPQNKQIQANLTRNIDGMDINGKDLTFAWLREELERRNPEGTRPVVFLSDGEHALEDRAFKWFEIDDETGVCCFFQDDQAKPVEIVFILDLFHALVPLWDVASIFHEEGTPQRKAFVEKRLRMLLQGKVKDVIRGLRQMKTKHRLRGDKARTIDRLANYYEHNIHRMRYDEYLAQGYPIGSGVVEGACGNLIFDRLERTGMRWDTQGAQAMLDLRAIWINGQWDQFCTFRVKHESQRLYPYRHLFNAA